MKVKTVTRIALCAFTLVFAASYTKPAHALPDYEIDQIWYTGCGSNVTLAGYNIGLCAGGHTIVGQQSGDWYEYSTIACDPENPDQGSYSVYEWCNGQWQARSTLGDCQCSH
jgi:hypothetical protein